MMALSAETYLQNKIHEVNKSITTKDILTIFYHVNELGIMLQRGFGGNVAEFKEKFSTPAITNLREQLTAYLPIFLQFMDLDKKNLPNNYLHLHLALNFLFDEQSLKMPEQLSVEEISKIEELLLNTFSSSTLRNELSKSIAESKDYFAERIHYHPNLRIIDGRCYFYNNSPSFYSVQQSLEAARVDDKELQINYQSELNDIKILLAENLENFQKELSRFYEIYDSANEQCRQKINEEIKGKDDLRKKTHSTKEKIKQTQYFLGEASTSVEKPKQQDMEEAKKYLHEEKTCLKEYQLQENNLFLSMQLQLSKNDHFLEELRKKMQLIETKQKNKQGINLSDEKNELTKLYKNKLEKLYFLKNKLALNKTAIKQEQKKFAAFIPVEDKLLMEGYNTLDDIGYALASNTLNSTAKIGELYYNLQKATTILTKDTAVPHHSFLFIAGLLMSYGLFIIPLCIGSKIAHNTWKFWENPQKTGEKKLLNKLNRFTEDVAELRITALPLEKIKIKHNL